MLRYKNILLVGTSHIAKQSLKEVEFAIEHGKPEIVALELDRKRFYALMNNEKRKVRFSDVRRVGIKGFLFSLFGAWAEKKLGKYVGMKPGADMLKAIELAKKNNIKIALIDQDIEITLAKISKGFSFREKWNFFIDVIKGLLFRKSELRKLGIDDIDLSKVPSKALIKKLTKKFKERYPSLYRVLIEERNQIMASRLKRITEQNPESKIVAVVGAGHEEEIISMIR